MRDKEIILAKIDVLVTTYSREKLMKMRKMEHRITVIFAALLMDGCRFSSDL